MYKRQLRYRADYDAQEQALQAQMDKLRSSAQDEPLALPLSLIHILRR